MIRSQLRWTPSWRQWTGWRLLPPFTGPLLHCQILRSLSMREKTILIGLGCFPTSECLWAPEYDSHVFDTRQQWEYTDMLYAASMPVSISQACWITLPLEVVIRLAP